MGKSAPADRPAMKPAGGVPTASPIAGRTLRHLRDIGPATVTELAVALDVSRTSAENAVNHLCDLGVVEEADAATARGAGRPARRYRFHAGYGVVAGIDVGVHSIRIVFADAAGTVLAQHDLPGIAISDDGPAQLAVLIADLRRALESDGIPLTHLKAIGVSLPGIVDESGHVLASVVLPGWVGVDIGARLLHAFGCPVGIDNGVRLAAVAEHHLGVAQLVDDVLYLSVGERIAMGLIIDGAPRRGAHDLAGDIGRVAFRDVTNETGRIRWSTAETAPQVFDLARAGNHEAQAELDRFEDVLVRGVATLVMAIDPDMVVIGGGLSLAEEELLAPLREKVAAAINLPISVPMAAARLGGDAAVHGALVLGFESLTALPGVDGVPVPQITTKARDAFPRDRSHR